ncbi:DUF4336 domain-containing protein [Roseateles amylovorans]|uniref:DUF4336 domain-containing protein n=1 Tax=Roseateles amylovorans TaxID=2978473 RepID=A0ABY6AZX4_9BURK|nr:DUF4336 domain-containing protein [Roseateles amylovorans]UXH78242.1 DUF4336 domain-containing protein [Roseateles amylovorans]
MTSPKLIPVCEDIWQVRRALVVNGVPAHTRMTVVRLASGQLWVHSPVAPCADLITQLQQLGPVVAVVAPNCAHHLFAGSFMQAFPQARLYLAPGLARKRPDLQGHPLPDEPGNWQPDLAYHLWRGMPLINETVWFHARSGTLILTDVCQWWTGDALPWQAALWARLTRVRSRVGVPLHVRALVRDAEAAAASARQILNWPIQRISLAHDALVDVQAHEQLARALAPLLRRGR